MNLTSTQFVTLFYIPSKPAAVQFLFTGTYGLPGSPLSPEDRIAKAKTLATKGEIIDVNIDALGADCLETMTLRLSYGQGRYPDLNQEAAMGGVLPAGFNYNDPGLVILNSINPSDYVNRGPVISTLYVGQQASLGYFNVLNSPENIFLPGQQHFEQNLYWLFVKAVTGQYFWQLVGMNALPQPVF